MEAEICPCRAGDAVDGELLKASRSRLRDCDCLSAELKSEF
jgi:hypothetical protein